MGNYTFVHEYTSKTLMVSNDKLCTQRHLFQVGLVNFKLKEKVEFWEEVKNKL